MPSAFKELCCPINSNSAQYHVNQLLTIISEPESVDTDTQDGKEGGEKEAETYENVSEYLSKRCCPQGGSKAEKSVLRRMLKKF